MISEELNFIKSPCNFEQDDNFKEIFVNKIEKIINFEKILYTNIFQDNNINISQPDINQLNNDIVRSRPFPDIKLKFELSSEGNNYNNVIKNLPNYAEDTGNNENKNEVIYFRLFMYDILLTLLEKYDSFNLKIGVRENDKMKVNYDQDHQHFLKTIIYILNEINLLTKENCMFLFHFLYNFFKKS